MDSNHLHYYQFSTIYWCKIAQRQGKLVATWKDKLDTTHENLFCLGPSVLHNFHRHLPGSEFTKGMVDHWFEDYCNYSGAQTLNHSFCNKIAHFWIFFEIILSLCLVTYCLHSVVEGSLDLGGCTLSVSFTCHCSFQRMSSRSLSPSVLLGKWEQCSVNLTMSLPCRLSDVLWWLITKEYLLPILPRSFKFANPAVCSTAPSPHPSHLSVNRAKTQLLGPTFIPLNLFFWIYSLHSPPPPSFIYTSRVHPWLAISLPVTSNPIPGLFIFTSKVSFLSNQSHNFPCYSSWPCQGQLLPGLLLVSLNIQLVFLHPVFSPKSPVTFTKCASGCNTPLLKNLLVDF
jgi:hypothetical protein